MFFLDVLEREVTTQLAAAVESCTRASMAWPSSTTTVHLRCFGGTVGVRALVAVHRPKIHVAADIPKIQRFSSTSIPLLGRRQAQPLMNKGARTSVVAALANWNRRSFWTECIQLLVAVCLFDSGFGAYMKSSGTCMRTGGDGFNLFARRHRV